MLLLLLTSLLIGVTGTSYATLLVPLAGHGPGSALSQRLADESPTTISPSFTVGPRQVAVAGHTLPQPRRTNTTSPRQTVTAASDPAAAKTAAASQDPATPQDPTADAYLDATAREMVRLARLRRQTVDRSITAYQVLARERTTFQLGAGRHERLAHREETVARIHWRRGGPVQAEMLGAREATPLFLTGVRLPSLYRMSSVAFDPADSQLFVMSRRDQELVQVRHPLANNSEAHYRFATGDSTSIRLPDGRAFVLRELRILPRRSDADLITGSFWLDTETHSVVRAVYRLARPWDLRRDEDEHLPWFVPDIFLNVEYYTVDYSLWNLRWWLPHHVSVRGLGELGAFRAPIQFELFYSDYVVEGDVAAADVEAGPGVVWPDSLEVPSCRMPYRVLYTESPIDSMAAQAADQQTGAGMVDPRTELAAQQRDSVERERRIRNDSIAAERRARRENPQISDAEAAAAGHARAERTRANWQPRCILEIVRPEDPQALITSEWFDQPIWDPGPAFLDRGELERVTGTLKRAAKPPWQLSPPRISGLTRYNRVEGLSLGGRAQLDLGRLHVDATAQLGTADLTPDLELGLDRRTRFGILRLAGFQRLALVDPEVRALHTGNSLNALLFGRDDGDYFRARGAELTRRPGAGSGQWYDWRIFAEHQTPVQVGTQFSVRRNVFNRRHTFRPNVVADSADQLGAALRLHTAGGLDSEGFRWGAELSLDGQTGTYRFARPAAVAHVWVPLPRRLLGRFELAGGSSTGQVPAQSLWYLGGPASMRGYAPATAAGQAFWRGRAAVSTRFPGVRLEAFTDLGWAGDPAQFTTHPPLHSAGAGVTFLDGIIRFDVARPLRESTGWRVDLTVAM